MSKTKLYDKMKFTPSSKKVQDSLKEMTGEDICDALPLIEKLAKTSHTLAISPKTIKHIILGNIEACKTTIDIFKTKSDTAIISPSFARRQMVSLIHDTTIYGIIKETDLVKEPLKTELLQLYDTLFELQEKLRLIDRERGGNLDLVMSKFENDQEVSSNEWIYDKPMMEAIII